MSTILTGIRVNGEMTLGNYLGALLPMVRLANKFQDEMRVNIFVPDLHTIISEVEGDLRENVMRSVKYYLAAGLKVGTGVKIYRQSRVPAHSELNWILNCTATMGELMRMTQFKEKGEGKESVNVGIFDYPVLMAADILLYEAEYVPVGEDQFQHLELARNLAERFNRRFEEVFVMPKKTAEQVGFLGQEKGVRIRDLVNPEKKMSKSAKAENSKILMSDEPRVAAKKIMSATTDSVGEVKLDFENQAGISNLLQIEALVNGRKVEEVAKEWEGVKLYGELKKKVAGSVEELLVDFRQKYEKISDEEVLELLEEGEKYAREVSRKKLDQVWQAVGL